MILLTLFLAFFRIGAFSIGGGYAIIPLISDQVVNHYHWLTTQEFTDIITISQMTPGPVAVNTSTFTGMRIAGIPGAIAATTGCIIMGIILSLTLYYIFTKFEYSIYIKEIMKGLKSASIGFIMSASLTIALLAFFPQHTFDLAALIIFLLSLFTLKKYHISPIKMIIISGILGCLLYI